MIQQSIEIQEIDINLRTQHPKNGSKAFKKVYLFGAVLLPIISFAIMLYEFSWTTLFYFILFCANAPIYFALGTDKDPYRFILGKSYIKVNAQELKLKKTLKKPVALNWKDVQEIKIRLFAAEAILKDGNRLSFDFEELSDDNLKLVKQQLHVIKDVYQL